MNKLLPTFLIAATASAVPSTQVLFDNTNDVYSGSQAVYPTTVLNNGWWGGQFSTSSDGYTISYIYMALNKTANAATNYSIKIYDSVNNLPTSSVATVFSDSVSFGSAGKFLGREFTGLNITLQANHTYYLVTEVTTGSLAWEYTNDTNNNTAYNFGSGWSYGNTFPVQFRVDALTSTPVPEASTYGIALGGLAIAAAVVRRRKQAK